MEIITKNSRETQKLAATLARRLVLKRATRVACLGRRAVGKPKAVILALRGDLGAGKTTFIQGFARGLGIREKILSPTFVILKIFKITKRKTKSEKRKIKIQNLKYLYHIDCYRVDNPKEILELGFKEIIANPENIVVIEWAERIRKILPKNAIWMKFEWIDKDKRRITIKN